MPPVATFRTVRRIGRTTAFALLLGLAPVARCGAAPLAWSIEITPDGELFPSLDLSQRPAAAAAPGGGNGLVLVRVHGDGTPRHLVLRIETPGLRAPAVVEADLGARDTIGLRPRLDWDIERLRAMRSAVRQPLRASLEASALPAGIREIGVRVHPLDDALYYVREGKDRIDLGWVFAAYVDPGDPVVDEIVAAARALDRDFDRPADHSAGDADARVRKAAAIWAALVDHGLRYAAGDPALSRGPSIYSQRVRLLGDVWRERRANCLDGSVLIASVLERIGIPAFIVLVPGHAFVGFRANPGDGPHSDPGRAEFLETTLLGASSRQHADAASSFAAARAAGRARWRKAAPRFAHRHGPDYALIDIGTARSYGIIPLGAHGDGRRGGASAVRTAAGLPRPNHPP
jgi:transglutaminase-like putative cysteine protease